VLVMLLTMMKKRLKPAVAPCLVMQRVDSHHWMKATMSLTYSGFQSRRLPSHLHLRPLLPPLDAS
jgi:hypothetical protein